MADIKKIINFFFEVGSLRFLKRAHVQQLRMTSDNIADHTFRVAMIGWCLAIMENADVDKVIKMCLLHDLEEARTGDQNWIHQQYVKVASNKLTEEQLAELPFEHEAKELIKEYKSRQGKEALVTKDADHLEQLCQIKECELQGHQEVQGWLDYNSRLVVTESAKKLAQGLKRANTKDWWFNIALRKYKSK